MESKKTCLAILCSLALLQAPAQKIWEERKGCIRAQGNLAGGYLFAPKQVSGYLTGDVDVFVDSRVSVTGQAWYSFALSNNNKPGIKANHAVFFGANYHPVKTGRWDPYIGFTPGVGIVQATYRNGEALAKTSYAPVPLISAQIGCNFYVGWLMHFFAKVQGVSGQFFKDTPTTYRLEEIKISAGLGWNIRAWKPKKQVSGI